MCAMDYCSVIKNKILPFAMTLLDLEDIITREIQILLDLTCIHACLVTDMSDSSWPQEL